ncbi:MAG: GAF domain-containing protein [Ignavibacteriae bacterium]|nr:GAF domain-containing protein [Ignavibacteriota bacterium]
MDNIAAEKGLTYPELLVRLDALCEGWNGDVSLLANAAALIYWSVNDLNWAGFYLMDGTRLVLGPFHGQPACVFIDEGKGVCGAAASSRATVVVDDVDLFPGHIACDSASRSEIVVPLCVNGDLFGVLDVDSPIRARFGDEEKAFFEAAAATLGAAISSSRRLLDVPRGRPLSP